ncbi:hypothetical protein QR680_017118 [Steinernema hermaphroditum]|uniref:Uncharacterized protein n=1 Tax=Steinernema hermaphroditum TaxID=289476 RepID=A0AA39HEK3_9BILA|nr:hypothetical protein QR680_017118 [Steinernema hermaphroditum]
MGCCYSGSKKSQDSATVATIAMPQPGKSSQKSLRNMPSSQKFSDVTSHGSKADRYKKNRRVEPVRKNLEQPSGSRKNEKWSEETQKTEEAPKSASLVKKVTEDDQKTKDEQVSKTVQRLRVTHDEQLDHCSLEDEVEATV